jgi:hypothetical protein
LKKTGLPIWVAGACVALAFLASGCNDPGPDPAASTNNAATGSGSVTLSWEAPTTNTDGTPLTNLGGYTIYYGTSPSHLDQAIQIKSVGVQTYVIDDLASGNWYFAIMAVTTSGTESSLSNVVEGNIT